MYLKTAYILLTLSVIIILLIIGFKAIDSTISDDQNVRKKKSILVFGLLAWQAYVLLVAYSGILNNFEFPPRFFIFLILPLFIFTGLFIYRNRNKNWISKIPPHWLVYYQSFRILIESIFVISVAQGILNREVTIKGYNYDMVFAYTAPIIGYLLLKNRLPKKMIVVWNYVGLAVIATIIFLFTSSIYNPQIFGSSTMLLPKPAVTYPYVLVAGFLMPSAVFIHILSIVQLSRKVS